MPLSQFSSVNFGYFQKCPPLQSFSNPSMAEQEQERQREGRRPIDRQTDRQRDRQITATVESTQIDRSTANHPARERNPSIQTHSETERYRQTDRQRSIDRDRDRDRDRVGGRLQNAMKGIFKPKVRSPAEIVRATRDLLSFFLSNDQSSSSLPSKGSDKVLLFSLEEFFKKRWISLDEFFTGQHADREMDCFTQSFLPQNLSIWTRLNHTDMKKIHYFDSRDMSKIHLFGRI